MLCLNPNHICLQLCWLIATISTALPAQNQSLGIPFIESWEVNKYRGGTQSWGFSEDREGRLLVANNAGLLRFDGQHWDVFPLSNSTKLRSLSIDTAIGQLMVGGQGTFGIYDPTPTGGLVYRPLSDQLTDSHKEGLGDVWRVLRLSDGRYCFNTTARLFIFGKDQRYERPIEPLGNGNFEFAFEKDGNIYVFEERKGLFRLNSNNTLDLISGSEVFKNDGIAAILALPDGSMLAASHSLGLFRWDGQTFTPWQTAAQDFFRKNHLYCGIRLSDGSMAFGTTRGGCLVLSPTGIPRERYSVENGLPVNFIRSLGEDRFGNLWMGLDNGIACSMRQSPFRRVFPHEGRTAACFSAIMRDNQLWIADAEGVSFEKKQTPDNRSLLGKVFEPLSGVPISGESWRLYTAPDGRFLLGQHRGAFEINDEHAILIDSTLGGWKFLAVPGKPGWLLEGTYSGLVAHPPPGQGKPFKLAGFSQSCRVMAFDTKMPNEVWVSHVYLGVYRLRIDLEKRMVEFLNGQKLYASAQGCGGVFVLGGFEFGEKGPVFGALNGVYCFDHPKNQFLKAPEWDTLLGGRRHLQALTKGYEGRWWWVADNQLGYFDELPDGKWKLPKDFTFFKKLDSSFVKDFEFLLPLPNGHLLVGTTNGCVIWDNAKWTKQPFNTLIRNAVLLRSGRVITPDMSLNADDNDIKFEFAAPFFEDPSKTLFCCQLDGFEDDTTWTNIPMKEYHNLPPGRYTLRVVARNLYGTEGKLATISFHIKRPWWWYALGLALTIAGIAIYFWRRHSFRQIEAFIEMVDSNDAIDHLDEKNAPVNPSENAPANWKNLPDDPPAEFILPLKSMHPNLGDTEQRLAWLTAIDRRSSYIIKTLGWKDARTLASRRWELKHKLELSKEKDLKGYLQGFLNKRP